MSSAFVTRATVLRLLIMVVSVAMRMTMTMIVRRMRGLVRPCVLIERPVNNHKDTSRSQTLHQPADSKLRVLDMMKGVGNDGKVKIEEVGTIHC